MSKLEQAKAVLMEDKDAAAAEHTAAIGRINTHTSKIFAVFKRDLYLTMGGCGAQALPPVLQLHLLFIGLVWLLRSPFVAWLTATLRARTGPLQ